MALEVFVPNTGQGDCTFIKFPNGKNMIVDFNKTDVAVDILELLRNKIPMKRHDDIDLTCRRINYLVITHPHEDHLRGIKALNDDEFYIDEIWESNHRLYVPANQKSKYQNYYDFLDLVNKLKRRSSVKVLKAQRAVFKSIGASDIYVFSPSRAVADSSSRDEIHNQCGVLKVEYAGNSILFAGDTDRDSWENRIVKHYSDDKIENGKRLLNLLNSTIFHVSHHGSKYFFVAPDDDNDRYTTSMDKISPSFSVVSVGAGNPHGHPHRIAMNIYKDKTKYGRVFKTKDDNSMYFAFKSDGTVEYKKGLSKDNLLEIKYKDTIIKSAAATLAFNLGKELELELPKEPPKGKREGYA